MSWAFLGVLNLLFGGFNIWLGLSIDSAFNVALGSMCLAGFVLCVIQQEKA